MAMIKRGATVVHDLLSTAELYNKVNVTVPLYTLGTILDITEGKQLLGLGNLIQKSH